jgi:hypothetical protein
MNATWGCLFWRSPLVPVLVALSICPRLSRDSRGRGLGFGRFSVGSLRRLRNTREGRISVSAVTPGSSSRFQEGSRERVQLALGIWLVQTRPCFFPVGSPFPACKTTGMLPFLLSAPSLRSLWRASLPLLLLSFVKGSFPRLSAPRAKFLS